MNEATSEDRAREQTVRALRVIHAEFDACRACPSMQGPAIHGPAVASRVLLLGQAPGPHEGKHGRPFAWTAGKTLFQWFEGALGVREDELRARVYMAAVARCFPGKAKGGRGDRVPDRDEIARCGGFLSREVQALRPALVLAVGKLAIDQVLGTNEKLVALVGTKRRASFYGVELDVIPLPHPSGASPWPRVEPGKALLAKAMALVAEHPEVKRAFAKEK